MVTGLLLLHNRIMAPGERIVRLVKLWIIAGLSQTTP